MQHTRTDVMVLFPLCEEISLILQHAGNTRLAGDVTLLTGHSYRYSYTVRYRSAHAAFCLGATRTRRTAHASRRPSRTPHRHSSKMQHCIIL